MTVRIVGDLSSLPENAFGHRTLMWWGVMGFILIEGGAFALAIASYFFLMGHTDPWPPHRLAPDLLPGALFTVLALLSEIPNVLTDRAAKAGNVAGVRLGLVVMSVIGIVLVAIRFFEFPALHFRWDENAYGSIVWALLFLHTTHVITDLADTLVVGAFTFTHRVDESRLSDVSDNCLYWHFVVLAWLPIWAVLYLVPRWIG